MIPLLHDFEGETVVVFGGGTVGARKARRFAREARVVVLSPAFADRSFGEATLVRAAPDPGDVAAWLDRTDPVLAVAATDDPGINDAVAIAARERSIAVNRADRSAATGDDPDEGVGAAGPTAGFGDVVVPATVRDDPVVVAIATGGASPALSKYLRERVAEDLDGAGAMAELTADLRAELREQGVDPEARREAVRRVVRSSRVWTALRTGNSNGRQVASEIVTEVLPEGQG